jgi:GH25 family lysozyme M1 (1,4-beta-N-acetylmuramidase)
MTIRTRFPIRASIALTLVLVAGVPAMADTSSDGFAGSSGSAALTPSTGTVSGLSGSAVKGIDVSHWQGTIDWARVAAAGKTFVFLKATDDANYVDPTFAANRSAALANGLSVGAYHYARPDRSAGDARREARYFVAVANPQPGDLLPVLDLEENKGLNHDELTAWTRTWVRVVRKLTGVSALVYTSPATWVTGTGDSPLVARDGAPLWIAHWNVSSPTIPANDWDGHGWHVWQYTNTGHVPGISGNVDLDQISSSTLGPIIVRQLSIGVSGSAGRVTSSVGLTCAGTCSSNVDPGAVITLTAVPNENAYFTGWGGPCSGSAPTCTVTMNGSRVVGASFVTDITPPVPTFTAPAKLVGPMQVAFDENVRGVTPWNVLLRDASGAKVAVARTCRSAAGASVPCDGAKIRSVTLQPTAPLVPGADYTAVVDPPGTATSVSDKVGNATPTTSSPFQAARSVQQTSPVLTKLPARAWTNVRAAGASGGSYALASGEGATIRMPFDGTQVDWNTVTGPNRGRADVYVDGSLVRTVDLYSSAKTFGVSKQFGGLADGPHVIRIVVLGTKRTASTGTSVTVDRFDVVG